MSEVNQDKISLWKENWQKEVDGEFLYRRLAGLVDAPNRRKAYEEMADMEKRHAEIWSKYLRAHDVILPVSNRPSTRSRLLAWIARRFGPMAINNLLASEEVRDMGDYHEQSKLDTS